ncbi:MAG: hypothetical protein WBE85_15530, partial [Methylocella sp.]
PMPLRLSATLTTLGFQGSGQMGNLNVNHPDKHGSNDRQLPIAACCTDRKPHNITNQTTQALS